VVIALKAGPNLVIRKLRFQMHAHEQMEVVAHQAKAQHLGEIDATESLDEGEQILLLHVSEHEAVQGRPRDNMVDRRLAGNS